MTRQVSYRLIENEAAKAAARFGCTTSELTVSVDDTGFFVSYNPRANIVNRHILDRIAAIDLTNICRPSDFATPSINAAQISQGLRRLSATGVICATSKRKNKVTYWTITRINHPAEWKAR